MTDNERSSRTVDAEFPRAARPRARGRRAAFTLLEVTVALVVLAVVAALVAPALDRTPGVPAGALGEVVQRSRDLAVRRAQAMSLQIEREGVWHLVALRTGELVAEGQLASPVPGRAGVELSPLGACVPDSAATALLPGWDPLRCAPASGARGRLSP